KEFAADRLRRHGVPRRDGDRRTSGTLGPGATGHVGDCKQGPPDVHASIIRVQLLGDRRIGFSKRVDLIHDPALELAPDWSKLVTLDALAAHPRSNVFSTILPAHADDEAPIRDRVLQRANRGEGL